MVKMSLQIKATLEKIEELYTNNPQYTYHLKLKCLNCGEMSNKWHGITEIETFASRTGRSETHYLEKCKLCGRENSLDILPATHAKYTSEDQGKFKSIITFDCRGIEPIDFTAANGWLAKVEESPKIYDVDFTEGENEWVDYDEKIKESIGVYELESQFIKVK